MTTEFENRIDFFFDEKIVQTNELFFKTIMETDFPTVDMRKGSVIYDLLIRPAGAFHGLNLFNVNRMRRSMSLREITVSPEIADRNSVDDLLSNFGLTRKGGQKAGGSISIILSTNNTTSIPSGSTFTSGTLQFITQQSFIGVPSANLISKETDRLIIPIEGDLFSFDIEVIATQEGSEFQLTQGTAITIDAAPINYVSSKVASDFSAGITEETNEELITRLATGISGKTTASRKHIRSFIEEQFVNTIHGSVIGFGQPEMTRDQNNIFSISFGGKSDIYVQSDTRPVVEKLVKTATLVNVNTSLWQLSLDRDEFAGVMQITKVLPAGSSDSGTLEVVSDVRNINTTPMSTDPDAFIPDIQTYTQGAFSRYQTSAIQFIDSTLSPTELAAQTSRDYDVYLKKLPNIAEIQDTILSDPLVSSHRYDDLVRTPIPVFVSMSLTVKVPINSNVDKESIKSAIAKRINELNFTSSLSSSIIVDEVHNQVSIDSMVVMPISMLGELINPVDGTSQIFRSTTNLVIPDDFSRSISKRTVMFFCDPEDVDITVVTL